MARDGLDTAERDLDALLDLSEQLGNTGAIEQTLLKLADLMADTLGSDRCSVVLLDSEAKQGIIVAASDDPAIKNLALDLTVYPEMREVMRTAEPLVINDVHQAALFDEVRERLRGKPVGSTILFPVRVERKVQAVLHLRTELTRNRELSPREIRFGRIVANATGIALRNARLYETVRDRSERRLNDRIRAERRLRQIEKYQRFFDFAGDGLMIIDGTARVLFANPMAQKILGFAAPAISTLTLYDIVEQGGKEPLDRVVQSVGTGTYLRDVDISVIRANGERAVLSLTTATLDDPDRTEDIAPIIDDEAKGRAVGLKKDATAIVSFRDVTETRRMQEELRRTKDFLMNLIESSADAIVAADMGGRILIFNEAAERITGFAGVQMIGEPVADLYPPGVAQRIMADLRSGQFGGKGRIGERREHLVTKEGDLVPVSLAAAIVYDGGQEVATVGIFSDLRERLRMEEELLRAQEKLQLSERQAAVAQLAGAAAHELNQPLTSIIGMVELLQRKATDAPLQRNLDALLREADRLAEKVKQLGQITRYETKPYIGRTEILDLDAASGNKEKS